MKRLFVLAITAALITTACRKDIHLNLQNAAGLMVIEGNINDQPGPYNVLLSKTITFYDSNSVVPVSGGHVVITDNLGNRDSLIEVAPGKYQTSTLTGVPGRTYHLSVSAEGEQYDASSTMPPPIAVDSVYRVFFFRGFLPTIEFQDPINISNYYKAILYVNGYPSHKINITNDKLTDGKKTSLICQNDKDLVANDTLNIELQCLDQPVWDYFSTMRTVTNNSQSAAPANPTSNISNNALGYFSAYSSTQSKPYIW